MTALSQLAALQEIDRQQRERTTLVEDLKAEVAGLESQRLLQREATQAKLAEREALEARRRELEAALDTEEVKMKDRRMRLNRVRNEKELQALRREIELGKEANQQLEEGLMGVLESLEALTASLAEAQQNLTVLEETVATQITQRRARMDELVTALTRDLVGRKEVAGRIDASLLRKYEQIFERRGGTAVVEVRSGTCLGCHMHLPPQLFNELQRSSEVRLCPNCHRILYWRAERVEPSEPAR